MSTTGANELAAASRDWQPAALSTADGAEENRRAAGARIDSDDPLAVLAHGKTAGASRAAGRGGASRNRGRRRRSGADAGTIVSLDVAAGSEIGERERILVMEAMKMEHEIRSPVSGAVRELAVSVGDTVYEGSPLAFIEEKELAARAGGGGRSPRS